MALEPTFEEAGPHPDTRRGALPWLYDRSRRTTRHLKLWPSLAEETSPERWPAWFTGLARLNEPASFEVIGLSGSVQFLFVAHAHDVPILADAVTVHQDHAWLEPLSADPLQTYCKTAKQGDTKVELHFLDYYSPSLPFLPLFAAKPPEVDPLEALYTVLADLAPHECALWQVLFAPARRNWRAHVRDRLSRDHTLSEHALTRIAKGVSENEGLPLFAAALRIALFAPHDRVPRLLARFQAAMETLPFRDERLCHISREEYAAAHIPKKDHLYMLLNRVSFRTGMLLSSRDLACLVHCPSQQALRRWSAIERGTKTYPVPSHLTHTGERIGYNVHRGVRHDVRISERLQNRHVIMTGKSGCGKSTLIQNMVREHLAHGDGFGVVDPHGALIRELILPLIPRERLDDVIYFNPGDFDHPIAFNILAHSGSKTEKEHIRVDLLDFFEELLEMKLGVTVAHLLNYALAVLLARPDATLADLERLLTDAPFRNDLLSGVTDQGIRRFWTTEFPALAKKGAVLTITNKLSPMLLPESAVRPMFIQRENAVNFLEIMNRKKIFLANLAIGALGQRNSELLGRLLVSKLQIAGMMREGLHTFPDWYLYLDEFQHMATPTMKGILTGARKYKLHLTLATQYIANVPEHLVGPVFNASTMVFFNCDLPKDQHFIEKVVAGRFASGEIGQLKRGEAVVKIEGHVFNLETAPPAVSSGDDLSREIIERSRKRYAGTAKADARPAIALQPAPAAVPTAPKTVHREPPRSPSKSVISYDQRKFLQYAAQDPHQFVTKIYTALGLSGYKGDKIKRTLIEDGLIAQEETRQGAGGRPAKRVALTAKGHSVLGGLAVPGKGGERHKDLQEMLKEQAELAGWKATVEERIDGSADSVDVGLEKHELKVAVEVSVTTDADNELANIAKCLAAGYDYVICAVLEDATLRALTAKARKRFTLDERKKIRYGAPSAVRSLLLEIEGRAMSVVSGRNEANSVVRTQNALFAVKEAAAFLGVSRMTLYSWVSQRKIAFVKVGRLTKFRREDLDKWLERRRTEEDRRDFLA